MWPLQRWPPARVFGFYGKGFDHHSTTPRIWLYKSGFCRVVPPFCPDVSIAKHLVLLTMKKTFPRRLVLYLWCWSTFEKFCGAAQRIAEYAALKWEGSQKAGTGVSYYVGILTWLWKPWPIEIDDLPIKTGDSPAMWQIIRGHKLWRVQLCITDYLYTYKYMYMNICTWLIQLHNL